MVIEDRHKSYKCPHCGSHSLKILVMASGYCLECKKRFDLKVLDVSNTDNNEALGIFMLKENKNEKK